jgi:iron complex transport system permease protein
LTIESTEKATTPSASSKASGDHQAVTLTALAALLAVLIAGASLVGAFPISMAEVATAIARKLAGGAAVGQIDTVLFGVRLPRVFAAVLVGAAIAAAGAAYQTIVSQPARVTRHPGRLDWRGSRRGARHLPVATGGRNPAAGFHRRACNRQHGLRDSRILVRGREPILVLVLAGVVVGSLAGAVISLLKILADPYDQLPAIVFWLLGSLSAIRKGEVWTAAPLVLLGLIPLVLLRWRINVLSLGDEEAKALGVEAGRLRLWVIAAATLMTASVVAISGVIGWVGLVIPHIARMIVGPSFDRLLPTAMLLGASYLLAVDTLARTVARIEVPIGILTAVVGAPFFLWLLARGREGWS